MTKTNAGFLMAISIAVFFILKPFAGWDPLDIQRGDYLPLAALIGAGACLVGFFFAALYYSRGK
jgi:hypothetical protein